MMTRKGRLEALMSGRDYDRPPFNFYEINGIDQNPDDQNPFNIFNDPSWRPLLNLARSKSDIILLRGVSYHTEEKLTGSKKIYTEHFDSYYDENGSFHTIYEIEIDGRTLRRRTRQDKDIYTTWTTEHLLKDENDLEVWLKLPEGTAGIPDCTNILDSEMLLGEDGIVAIDTGDALCTVASLFSMEDYTVTAMMNPELFHLALERIHRPLLENIKRASKKLPGRMWRICGPEYAGTPYLPPKLYEEYVVRYDCEIMDAIRENGGYPRVHQHGNLASSLDFLVKMGAWGIDPIEPPVQGDVNLDYVRKKYGSKLVLFGNLESSDIEMLHPDDFEKKVVTALREGTSGSGGGFVLQPSAAPYGRKLSDISMKNYERLVDIIDYMYPGTVL